MLTKQQLKLFMIIDAGLKKNGICPSFDEMKEAIGLKSKSGVHKIVKSLEERGFITQLPNKARAISIKKYPMNYDDDVKNTIPINDNFKMMSIPLYGKIAAGTPISAIANQTETIDVPVSMLGRGKYYALKVEGDSMIDAGIHDGDRVIIEECKNAQNGMIVVALIDDDEATLKYFYKRTDTIALKPANPNYQTRIFEPNRVKIQGKLAMLIRAY